MVKVRWRGHIEGDPEPWKTLKSDKLHGPRWDDPWLQKQWRIQQERPTQKLDKYAKQLSDWGVKFETVKHDGETIRLKVFEVEDMEKLNFEGLQSTVEKEDELEALLQ